MRLREIREMANMSQRALGDKLGIANTVISKYERNVCDPSVENLIKMADIFGVSVDSLVGHNAELLDVKTLSDDQKYVVNRVVNDLSDTEVAKLVGYLQNMVDKK